MSNLKILPTLETLDLKPFIMVKDACLEYLPSRKVNLGWSLNFISALFKYWAVFNLCISTKSSQPPCFCSTFLQHKSITFHGGGDVFRGSGWCYFSNTHSIFYVDKNIFEFIQPESLPLHIGCLTTFLWRIVSGTFYGFLPKKMHSFFLLSQGKVCKMHN